MSIQVIKAAKQAQQKTDNVVVFIKQQQKLPSNLIENAKAIIDKSFAGLCLTDTNQVNFINNEKDRLVSQVKKAVSERKSFLNRTRLISLGGVR
ncbi:MAG: hypothetical protein GJ680_18285 [Alteromonadaceae bacterium]|nr:hypothetical protein [Alteromonadaceae bacterium]